MTEEKHDILRAEGFTIGYKLREKEIFEKLQVLLDNSTKFAYNGKHYIKVEALEGIINKKKMRLKNYEKKE